MTTQQPIARRSVIAGAGMGVLGAGLMSTLARAQTGAAPAAATSGAAPAAAQAGAEIWSQEYTAKKGDVPLNMWRKRLGAPKAGEAPRPVLFLVHGSSNSARSSYDLDVPGRGDYSLMNVFARYGFDVWTMDHDGYGRSGSSGNNSDIASSVEDLKAGTEVVVRETGQQKFHMCGSSSGAIRAGAFAMARPERVDRLVLVAFTYKGTGAPTLRQRAERLEYYRTHNRRLRDREMIRSIFTRDGHASGYDPAVADAVADAELKFGDQIPTGTYLDMTANLPLVHPEQVKSPVLLIRGEHDGIATVTDLQEFYAKLPNGDRQFVILPGVAHSVGWAKNRHLYWHTLHAFLTMPPGVTT
ncbi:MAG TPA: alpha/beta hydrolase [Xanthobacteraceae bacterium]|nr:alpha/beta hydrolase [Xanthobacteraceae bacterium]